MHRRRGNALTAADLYGALAVLLRRAAALRETEAVMSFNEGEA